MKNKRKIVQVVRYYKEFDRDEIRDNGVGVEIQDFTDPNLSEAEIEKIKFFYKEEFKDLDCIRSMHGPFIDLNPFSPDLDIRKISYNKYIKSLKIAAELEMDYIIFHSQMHDGHLEPIMKEYVMDLNKELFASLISDVPEYKGYILIENIFEKNPDSLAELIETIGQPRVRINLDIGHAKLMDLTMEDWIGKLKDNMIYMHIHSNNGDFDQHIPPKEGEIDLLYSLLDKYEIDPILSLEYKKQNLEEELEKYI